MYNGVTAAARGIVAQHGPRGLYRGLGITLVEIVPYSALQFGLYDSLNSAYNKYRVGLTFVSCMRCGSGVHLACRVSSLCTWPLQATIRHLQACPTALGPPLNTARHGV